jgi:hypothetical protein
MMKNFKDFLQFLDTTEIGTLPVKLNFQEMEAVGEPSIRAR